MSDDAKVLSNENGGIDFDPDALRAKYQSERDKRVRTDGNEQYGGGPVEFHEIIREWRSDGQMKGLKLS